MTSHEIMLEDFLDGCVGGLFMVNLFLNAVSLDRENL